MTVPSGIQYPSGFRFGAAYAIDQTTGRLKGTSPTIPYTGERFVGAKAWSLTIPKQRRIFHIDADRVGAADFLPPTETASGQISVSADNMTLDEILTGNKKVTIGNAATIAAQTSNQGFEPFVALLLWQQSINFATRLRTWRSFLIPRSKAVPMDAGAADKEVDGNYDILMTPSTANIFGANITTAIDGAVDAQYFKTMTVGRPMLAAWTGDGYAMDYTLQYNTDSVLTAAPTIDVGSLTVYKNGIVVSAGLTKITTKFTFAVPPLVTDDICAFWEY
jgi:hypothetical protein